MVWGKVAVASTVFVGFSAAIGYTPKYGKEESREPPKPGQIKK